MDRSANARSDADWKRCSGRFSRQRRMMESSAGGNAALAATSSGGSLFRMALMTSTADLP
jgi:hypothetical protein